MQSNKFNSRYTLSLRGASEARGNGRGMDNTSAKAARKLGYQVVEASTTNKFVEVKGAEGNALVGFYSDYGGFQVEVATAALAEELAQETGTELARKSNGRRIAVGSSESKLGEVLAIVTGGPVVKAEAKTEVAAPLAAIQAPKVEAPSLDVGAIVVAALAAGKTNEEVIALIAALKA